MWLTCRSWRFNIHGLRARLPPLDDPYAVDDDHGDALGDLRVDRVAVYEFNAGVLALRWLAQMRDVGLEGNLRRELARDGSGEFAAGR